MTEESAPFEGWAILELMGHRRMAGRLTEQTIGGGAFIRIDVPGDGAEVATQFYSPSAVYCITPTTEDVARKIAVRARPEPATRWELERPAAETVHNFEGFDDDMHSCPSCGIEHDGADDLCAGCLDHGDDDAD